MRPLAQFEINNLPGNASFTSKPLDARQLVCFTLQASATIGSLAGTFQVQVSNTPVISTFINYDAVSNPAVWTNLGTALTFSQASAASSQIVPKTDLSNVAWRVVFTDSSSGTNTSKISAAISALGL